MLWFRALLSPGALLLLVVGCAPDLPPIPTEGRVLCREGEDCPSGYMCKALIGQCVKVGKDTDAPSLTQRSVTPAAARAGALITATFTVSEQLATTPIVMLSNPGATAANFALAARDGSQGFTYTLESTGGEPEQTVNVVATLVDAYGNDAQDLIVGEVRFDFSSPGIDLPEQPLAYLGRGSQGTVEFTLSEDVASWSDPVTYPVVVVEETGATLTLISADPVTRKLRYGYTPSGNEPQQEVQVSITAADAAGNTRTLVRPAFVFDFTEPTVSSTEELTTLARAGDVAVVTFSLSEEVSGSPVVDLVAVDASGNETGASVPMTLARQSGQQFEMHYQFPSGSTGVTDYKAKLRSVHDVAGNVLADVYLASGRVLRLDAEAPRFASAHLVPSDPPNPKLTDGATLRIAFAVAPSDPTFTTTVYLDVGGAAYPLTLETAPASPGAESTHVLPIVSGLPERSGTVKLQVTDLAGNDSDVVVLGPITIDRSRPALVLDVRPSASTRPAHRGEVITITLTANEPLGGTPALRTALETAPGVFDAASPLPITTFSQSGATSVWTSTVATAAVGTYQVAVDVLDEAGNAASAGPALVAVDGDVPVLSGLTIESQAYGGSARFSRASPTSQLRLFFDSSKVLASISVGIGGQVTAICDATVCDPAGTIARVPASGVERVICCWDFANAGLATDGSYELRIEGTDQAGNVTGATTFVEVDSQSPALRLEPSTTLARLGELVTVAVVSTGARPEAIDPTTASIGTAGLFRAAEEASFASATAVSAVFAHRVGTGETGTYVLSGGVKDVVGNAGTAAPVTIVVDADPPVLSDFVTSRTPAHYPGGAVSVGFVASERLAGASLELDGPASIRHDGTCSELSTTAPFTWSCAYTLGAAAADPDGAWTLKITGRDPAGNETGELVPFVVDRAPPTLTLDRSPSGRAARAGESLTLTVVSDEPLDDTTVSATFSTAFPSTPGVVGPIKVGPSAYRWTFAVSAGAVGATSATVSAKDLAGNDAGAMAGATCGVLPCPLSWDGSIPTVAFADAAAFPPPGKHYSGKASFNSIDVHFTSVERLDLTTSLTSTGISVRVGADLPLPPTECTGPTAAGVLWAYTCTHVVTEGTDRTPSADGINTVRIVARDEATNEAEATRDVVIDRQPPALTVSALPAAGTVAGVGTFIQVLVDSDEPLVTSSVAYLASSAAYASCPVGDGSHCNVVGDTFSALGATSYAWKRLVQSGDNGFFHVRFTVADTVGNVATVPAAGSEVFEVKSALPKVNGLALVRDVTTLGVTTTLSGVGTYSKTVAPEADYSRVTLVFDSPDYFEIGRVRVSTDVEGGDGSLARLWTTPCTRDALGTGTPVCAAAYCYRCTDAFVAGDAPGNYVIWLEVTDAASNRVQSALPVTLDTTPPAVTWTVRPDPAVRPARSGETVLMTLTGAGDPFTVSAFSSDRTAPAVGAALPLAAPAAVLQPSFSWSYVVPAGAQGSYTLLARGRDAVANESATAASGLVLVDGVAPVLSSVAVYSTSALDPALLGPVAPVAGLRFVVDNADPVTPTLQVLPASVQVAVGAPVSAAMTCSVTGVGGCDVALPACAGPYTYSCERSLTGAGDGVYELSAFVEDLAGNLALASEVVTYDQTPPTVTLTVEPARPVRLGETVTVTLSSSEAIRPATLAVTPASLGFGAPTVTETRTVWKHTVAGGDTEPTYTVKVTPVDLAGNAAAELTGSIAVDSVGPDIDDAGIRVNSPPQASDLAYHRSAVVDDTRVSTHPCRSGVASCYPVELEIPVIPGTDVIAPALSYVTLGGEPLTYDATNGVWHMAADPASVAEGPHALAGFIADLAGNTTSITRELDIDFDFTAPLLRSAYVSPTLVGAGQTATLHLGFSEVVANPAVAVTDPSSAARPGFFGALTDAGGALAFTATHPVVGGDASGVYRVAVTADDLAGNHASIDPATTLELVVGGLKPGLSVDFGPDPQSGTAQQAGYLGWSEASPRLRSFMGAGGFTVDISSDGGTGTSYAWAPTASLSGTAVDALATDSLTRGNGDLYLTFANLPADTYQLTTWHHADAAGRLINIWVRDADHGSSTQILSNVPTTTGTTTPLPYTVQVRSTGSGAVQVHFERVGSDPTWLNGFSLAGTTLQPRLDAASVKDGETFTARFTLADHARLAFAQMWVGARTTASPCVETDGTFACSYTVNALTDTSGLTPVKVEVVDAAGNVLAGTTTIQFALEPPTLIAGDVRPTRATTGDEVDIGFAFAEPVSTFHITATPGLVGTPTGSNVDMRVFTYKYVVQPTDAQTSITIEVDATDATGNTMAATSIGSFIVDRTAPSASNVAGPTLNGPKTSFTVTFDTSETLAVAPTLWIAGTSQTCTAGTYPHYTCTHVIDAVGEGVGPHALVLQLRDLTGLQAFTSVGTVSYDFTAPVISSSVVARDPDYAPARVVVGELHLSNTNPLTGATGPVLVTATVVASEVLDTAVPPTMVAYCTSGTSLGTSVPLNRTSLDGPTVVFSRSITSGLLADGTWDLRVTWRDVALNTATDLPLPTVLVVNNAAPTLAMGQVALYRIPWGWRGTLERSGAPGTAEYFVYGGAGAVTDTDAAEVLAFRDAAGTSLLTSVTAPSGSPFRLDVAEGDRTVYLSVARRGGARSTPALAATQRWIAGFGGKIAGSAVPNPHAFTVSHALAPTRDDPTAVEQGAAAGIATVGAPLGTTGAGTWQQEAVLSAAPSPRSRATMVFDRWRGVDVLAGGVAASGSCDGGAALCGTTWERGVESWTAVAPADPEGDGEPAGRQDTAATFDDRRGVTVLYGGEGASGCDGGGGTECGATWEWNGASWKRAVTAAAGPGARSRHGLVHDPIADETVLVGGVTAGTTPVGSVSVFDGALGTWASFCTTTCGMPARAEAAVAFHRSRGAVVVAGGCVTYDAPDHCTGITGTTYERGASSFTEITPALPVPVYGAAMAYDEIAEELVLFGGCTDAGCTTQSVATHTMGSAGTWVAEAPATIPPARARHTMAFDGSRGMVVMSGGAGGAPAVAAELWGWTGSNWVQLEPRDLDLDGNPPGRRGAAIAPVTSGLGPTAGVLFGGCGAADCSGLLRDTWTWDGAGWRLCQSGAGAACETRPSARWGHAMATAAGGEVLLFGGHDGTSPIADTWSYDPLATPRWVNLTPGTTPAVRVAAAMAYSTGPTSGPVGAKVVLFGGCTSTTGGVCDGGYLQDTWWWDGGDWAADPIVADTPPPARGHHAMVSVGRVVYLVGGCSDTPCTALADVWRWDPDDTATATRWTQLAAGGFAARRDATLLYDDARARLLLIGGAASGPTDEVWEGDNTGTNWAPLPAITAVPARSHHVALLDTARRLPVVFGGQGLTGPLADTWAWQGYGDRRPGHTATFTLAPAGVASLTGATATVSWASASTGAELHVWRHGRWEKVGTVAAGAATGTIVAPGVPLAALGAAQELHFALAPATTAGDARAYGTVATDYVELTVEYTHVP